MGLGKFDSSKVLCQPIKKHISPPCSFLNILHHFCLTLNFKLQVLSPLDFCFGKVLSVCNGTTLRQFRQVFIYTVQFKPIGDMVKLGQGNLQTGTTSHLCVLNILFSD
jgi:hypothetical protein